MAGRTVKKQGKNKRKGGKGKNRRKGDAERDSGGASPDRTDAPARAAGTGGEGRPASPERGGRAAEGAASGARDAARAPGEETSADVAAPLARWFLWADSPQAVQRVILGLGALCALLFLFDIVWHRHVYVPGEGLWGYYAIAGFVSFTAIVLGAKALRTLIRRDEDYYGAAAIDAETYPEAGLERRAAREGEESATLLLVRDAEVIGTDAAGGGGSRA